MKQRERLQAERMFANAAKAAKTFTPGEPVNAGPTAQVSVQGSDRSVWGSTLCQSVVRVWGSMP